MVVVNVVCVAAAKAVSTLVWTDLTVAVSVTVVVAASRDRYDEKKACPASGVSLRAATHSRCTACPCRRPRRPR